jgi:predicted ATPase
LLKSWKLEHFKSVFKPTELQLAPLTIFAGANSSGKSTIIQSMLLTAQTLQSPVVARPIVLNGHMTRLGAFTDIVSNADEEEAVSVGFKLEFPSEESRGLRLGSVSLPSRQLYRRLPPGSRPVLDCEYVFSMRGDSKDKDILRLQPRLEKSRVNIRANLENEVVEEEIIVHRSRHSVSQRLGSFKIAEESQSGLELHALAFEVEKLTGRSSDRIQLNLANRKYAGTSFRHFIPSSVAVVYDAVETEIRQVVEALTTPGSHVWFDIDSEEINAFITETVRDIILAGFNTLLTQEELKPSRLLRIRIERNINELKESFSFSKVQHVYRALPLSSQGIVAQAISEKKEELRRTIRAGRPSRFELRFVPLPELLSTGANVIHQYFSSSVKYLGPLRDEPKPVYPLAGVLGPNDIGFRGEHTAAVLDVNRNTYVVYIPTSGFLNDVIETHSQRATLSDAVLDWLNYMGVGNQLRTIDRGVLGHELKVAMADSNALHDLTQVGVGVSQVLPILVLSLLAESGSTLIFEQPELHLHPRVQTRLADFFVAMSKLGKQCIVETHSEYLINRLRFRAATSNGKEISDSVVLYFVEKHAGQSTYREIRINEYGVIQDWPRGFFDENEANAAATLKAGLAKRKRQAGKKSDA